MVFNQLLAEKFKFQNTATKLGSVYLQTRVQRVFLKKPVMALKSYLFIKDVTVFSLPPITAVKKLKVSLSVGDTFLMAFWLKFQGLVYSTHGFICNYIW